MKKQRLGLIALGIVSAMSIILIAGCKTEKTNEIIMKEMFNNIQSQKSFTASFRAEMHLGEDSEEVSTIVRMDLENTKDPEAFHGNGSIDIEADGTTLGTKVERYLVKDESEDVSYVLEAGEWKELKVDEKETGIRSLYSKLIEHKDQFREAGKDVEVDGRKCFRFEGILKGDIVESLAQVSLTEYFLEYGIDEDQISNMEFPCILDVYQDDKLPACIYLDMKDAFTSVMKETGVAVGECYAEFTSMNYNNVDTIKLPRVNGGEDDFSVIPAEPVEINSDLGKNWNSFNIQINKKVIEIPCTVKELNAVGLTVSEEDIPKESLIGADDSQIVAFRDEAGNEISAEIYNREKEEKPLNECIVTAISVNAADIQNGGLTILFPGGIQIGSSKKELLETYGQPTEIYEDEEYGDTYSWYREESSGSCIVDLEGGSGLIKTMGIKNEE